MTSNTNDMVLLESIPKLQAEITVLDAKCPIPLDMDCYDWDDWFFLLTDADRFEHRDLIIVLGLIAGHKLQYLGDLFGISRERIRQIGAKYNLTTTELRQQRRLREKRREEVLTKYIHTVSLAHPELTLNELADWVEADPDFVLRALGPRRAIHTLEQQSREVMSSRVSDEALNDAIRRWYQQTSKKTSDSYDKWAREEGFPGKQTVMIRYGTWNNALIELGLETDIDYRGGVRPQISDDVLWAGLYKFYATSLPSYSVGSYEVFAKEHGLASVATVRHRLGSWMQIREKIQQIFRYAASRDGSWPTGERILEIIPEDFPKQIATVEEAIASLQKVAREITGPITLAKYESARSAEDVRAANICRLCGYWVNALDLAGLADRMSAKARYRYSQLNRPEDSE